jgi:hypothetical protein
MSRETVILLIQLLVPWMGVMSLLGLKNAKRKKDKMLWSGLAGLPVVLLFWVYLGLY